MFVREKAKVAVSGSNRKHGGPMVLNRSPKYLNIVCSNDIGWEGVPHRCNPGGETVVTSMIPEYEGGGRVERNFKYMSVQSRSRCRIQK